MTLKRLDVTLADRVKTDEWDSFGGTANAGEFWHSLPEDRFRLHTTFEPMMQREIWCDARKPESGQIGAFEVWSGYYRGDLVARRAGKP